MKTETKTVYIAFDGKPFDSEAACLAYERLHSGARIVGLTQQDIDAAISGDAPDIGDAIEAVAAKVRSARLERGVYKRRPKGTGATGEAQPADETSASMRVRGVEPPVEPEPASDGDNRAAA